MLHMDAEHDRSPSPADHEDWKRSRKIVRDAPPQMRDRSRSPVVMGRRGPPNRRASSVERESRYDQDGSNTMSRLPHMERSRLFVGNVSPGTEKRQITELFAPFGEVMGVSVHKGYAFVQMATERQANKAVNFLDQQKFNNNLISKCPVC